MGISKLIKISFFLLLIVISCQDKVKSEDNQNFKYIQIVGYPDKGVNAKLLIFEKKSNFKKKIKELNDFSLNFFTVKNSNQRALNIKLNFPNDQKVDYDMQLIVDNKYYYNFQDIMIKNDTFKKANILGNELHIYKIMRAKVNDSMITFDQHNSHSEKSIKLPFTLAEKL